MQLGESWPVVRDTPTLGRGERMVLWNTCMTGVHVDTFLVWFGRHNVDHVAGSVNDPLQSVTVNPLLVFWDGCFTALGQNVHVNHQAWDSGAVCVRRNLTLTPNALPGEMDRTVPLG